MFSPRAENLAIPGRLPAAPRSRWAKLPLRAIVCDQSAATAARLLSQASGARPRARRSALSRANRSAARVAAVPRPPPGLGAAVLGGAVAPGGRELLVAGRLVVAGPAAVLLVVAPAEGRGGGPAGTRANTSAIHRQPPGAAPTPRA